MDNSKIINTNMSMGNDLVTLPLKKLYCKRNGYIFGYLL